MTTLSVILIVMAEQFHIAIRIKSSPKAPTVGVLSECEHLQDLGIKPWMHHLWISLAPIGRIVEELPYS